MKKNNKMGQIGEKLAKGYLEKQGYEICQCNFWTPLGEIDLIVKKNESLFFVEVKTRRSQIFGSGMDAITSGKRQKIQKAAEIYLTDTEWSGIVRLMFIAIQYCSEENFSLECIIE